jgi:ATP-dependent helicase Lhr and Lhr-like helicase
VRSETAKSTPLAPFSEPVRRWFHASFAEPTPAQAMGWPKIAAGANTLICAPTGSGKTLAAFLWGIDRLAREPERLGQGVRIVYVSPLKALSYDIERNLRAPLSGIGAEISVGLRTGDTPQRERQAMRRKPPDILVTTPESLYLIMTSGAREILTGAEAVIVDEIHAVAQSKRGAHLALTLERLSHLAATSDPDAPAAGNGVREVQRIGLSATQRPLDRIARFLVGPRRKCEIADAGKPKELDLEIVVPVEDMTEPAPPDPLDPEQTPTRSVWPAIYPRLLEEIERHNSTIVFANSRRLAEKICAELNNLAGGEVARAHHGSVAREQRLQIEESLKRGELKAVVATSSLELGIDMGAVDLVIQVEAPTSVASGLQRIGRSGHQVEGISRARVFPKHRGDLLVATVIAGEMAERKVESTKVPMNPIDVLAQQIVADVVGAPIDAEGLYDIVRRAYPFSDLSRAVFDATLDMLAGRYPSDLFAELRPRVNWDRVSGELTPRPGSRQLAVTNGGTIPDRGLYRVALPDGSRVGELDEEMVYESREGDTFLLGSSSWRINRITHDSVEVVPAPADTAARMPFWHGDMMGRSLETGKAIGGFVRAISRLPHDEALTTLRSDHHLDDLAARNLIAYIDEEREETGLVPTDQTLVVERFRDEIGDWRLVLLSPLGARVHAPWAMALRHRFRARYGTDVDVIWSDDGIAFRFPDSDLPPDSADLVLEPEDVETALIEHLGDTALFAARFREAAGRSLLLPRRRPGERTPLWLQRRRSADLLGVARDFGTFPIILEVYREILQDDFDLPALQDVLADIRTRRIRVAQVDTNGPSPFASSLLFAFVAAYLYESDAPLAERRAAALTLDRDLLRELLGEGELRDLIDPEVVAAVELELQHLTDLRRATTADGIHDLLRDVGPLTTTDIEVRSRDVDLGDALSRLESGRRVIEVVMGGETRWAAVEDVSRLRDALGVQPPAGVAHVFLEPVVDPLGDLVGRFARTHGPFTADEAGAALGLPPAVVDTALRALADAGRVDAGAFRPGGAGREWVDREVLRRLKRRSLAILRSEIEAVDHEAFARFGVAWQGVRPDPPRGMNALHEAVARLAGAPIPASVLERDVLGSRVVDPGPGLDRLLLDGSLVWIGLGASGSSDGKIGLFPRDSLDELWRGPEPHPDTAEHTAILEALEDRGASFFRDIYEATGGGDPETALDRLWDLVWSGHVTNDTLEPVRAFVGARKTRSSGRPSISSRFPAHAGGRWSLTSHLSQAGPSDTARAAAWANLLLDRHGLVTRATVLAEGYPGGFSALYPVFSHLEETGRIRRGYFVEGLGGSQFALPGAVDRLRREADPELITLAATDPANPYGAALPWPESGNTRLARDAGAYVLLYGGRLVGFVERGRRSLSLLVTEPELYGAIGRGLSEIAARHRRTTLATVNGDPAGASSIAPVLSEWGFATAVRGLTYRG